MTSRQEMLKWMNTRLETNVSTLAELQDGWQYCQMVDATFGKSLPLSKVHFDARNEEQRLGNFKLLSTALEKLRADYPSGEVNFQKLAKGNQAQHLGFLTWFRRFCHAQEQETASYTGGELEYYPGEHKRQQCASGGIKATPAKMPNAATPKKKERPATAAGTGTRKRKLRASPPPEPQLRKLVFDDDGAVPVTPVKKGSSSSSSSTANTSMPPPTMTMGPAMAFLQAQLAAAKSTSATDDSSSTATASSTKRRKLAPGKSAAGYTVVETPLASGRSSSSAVVSDADGKRPSTGRVRAGATATPRVSVSNIGSARDGGEDGGGLFTQRLREELKELKEDKKARAQNEAKQAKVVKELESRLAKVQLDLRLAEEKARVMEKKCEAMREERRIVDAELRECKEKSTALQRHVEAATNELKQKDNSLHRAAEVRRMLHNSLQELKGNIRVFARMRPAATGETVAAGMFGFPDELDSRQLEIVEPDTQGVCGDMKTGKKHAFEFDKVFAPQASQAHVFEDVHTLVQSTLDGYKVCVFAYGQTGSGKTFTMEGTKDLPGLIPSTVRALFERCVEMRQCGWTMELKARHVEIYNNKLRDLLGHDGGDDAKIEVVHSKDGEETHLTNCTLVDVKSADGVLQVLEKASARRTVSSTNMNARSSRSHSVFTLRVVGRNESTQQTLSSEINLIDLAGSERVKQSGVTGEALKEAEHINSSLTHLGNVIQQLHQNKAGAKKPTHIFRNSTLTWMLRSCLGGDCKTLMIVNISPTAPSLPESMNSLRFATKVNNCQIGTATRRVK